MTICATARSHSKSSISSIVCIDNHAFTRSLVFEREESLLDICTSCCLMSLRFERPKIRTLISTSVGFGFATTVRGYTSIFSYVTECSITAVLIGLATSSIAKTGMKSSSSGGLSSSINTQAHLIKSSNLSRNNYIGAIETGTF